MADQDIGQVFSGVKLSDNGERPPFYNHGRIMGEVLSLL